MSQVRFTLSRRQAAALIEMASHGQGAVRRALADDVLARVGRRAAMHAVKPLEDHDLGPSLSERMARPQPTTTQARLMDAGDHARLAEIRAELAATATRLERVLSIAHDQPEDFAFLVVPRLHPDGPAAEGTSVLRLSRKAGQRAADLLTTAGAFNDVLERLVSDFHTDCSAAGLDSRSVAGPAGVRSQASGGAAP